MDKLIKYKNRIYIAAIAAFIIIFSGAVILLNGSIEKRNSGPQGATFLQRQR